MSIFDDLPFANFGQEEIEDFPLMDVNNNYLLQPFTNEEDSNGSIFDPDNNLIPPTSEIEQMPIQMPELHQIPPVDPTPTTVHNSPVITSFEEPMFSTIDTATTFQMTRPCRAKEEDFTIPNIMDEIPSTKCKDIPKPSPKRQPLAPLPVNCPVPHTPQKPMGENALDPLTPTANLKILMSAASPEIRNRDNMRKLLNEGIKIQQDSRRELRAVEDGQDEGSRKDKSLGLLCQRFLNLFPEYPDQNNAPEISLDAVSRNLGVERRRLYDIVNVLESVEMMNRVGKNRYIWHGKNRLAYTLRGLKIRATSEGYPALIRRCKEHERIRELQKLALACNGHTLTGSGQSTDDFVFRDPDPVSGDNLQNARSGLRKDKSLSIISQKFVMVFLAVNKDVISLELAAKILSNDIDIDKRDSSKFKTKIRRLYDIANILISLNLIEKVYSANTRGRKPGFTYIGPCLSDDCPKTDCCPHTSKAYTSTDSTDTRGRGRTAGGAQKKKSFVRHSSFDLICRAASEERERLYSSHPSSPEKVVKRRESVMTSHNLSGTVGLKTGSNRFINISKQPYLKLDQINQTELVITELNRNPSPNSNGVTASKRDLVTSDHIMTSSKLDDVTLTSDHIVTSSKRDGVTLTSDAKRPKTETDEEVMLFTDGIPLRVRTTSLQRMSPRALQFDNVKHSNTQSDQTKPSGEKPLTKTIRLVPNSTNTSMKSTITLVVSKRAPCQAPPVKNDSQYTTPVRVLSEKAITPSTRTTLFQAMQAKLKSPESESKPGMKSLLSSGRISFVRLTQGD